MDAEAGVSDSPLHAAASLVALVLNYTGTPEPCAAEQCTDTPLLKKMMSLRHDSRTRTCLVALALDYAPSACIGGGALRTGADPVLASTAKRRRGL